MNINDLPSSEDPRDIYWKLEDGREFELFRSYPVGSYLRLKPYMGLIQSTHPNLFSKILKLNEAKMDIDGLLKEQDDEYPLMKYLRSLSPE
eukprot:CAMPEP_0170487622 /NCGR_PEP_ID=MMETSP0208-20121228/6397_1 /TAXON_ID=197538 /ORGANISM="Strombidium inclinatum, Strain S3" /LENGTH=90 /DNA_ID=CAMNT_0010761965 /DNA_START=501 /DNA_END=773 /DNA_ORIENTATION=+